MNTSGKGAQAAGRAAAVKDNARVGVGKVELTLSASETFGLLPSQMSYFTTETEQGDKNHLLLK